MKQMQKIVQFISIAYTFLCAMKENYFVKNFNFCTFFKCQSENFSRERAHRVIFRLKIYDLLLLMRNCKKIFMNWRIPLFWVSNWHNKKNTLNARKVCKINNIFCQQPVATVGCNFSNLMIITTRFNLFTYFSWKSVTKEIKLLSRFIKLFTVDIPFLEELNKLSNDVNMLII